MKYFINEIFNENFLSLVTFNRKGNMVSRYIEVRLIFDKYLEQSLKARTRETRTAGEDANNTNYYNAT